MMDPDRVKKAVVKKFPQFGPNKIQEISRLVFEIAKRDREDHHQILKGQDVDWKNFARTKDILLARRYPHSRQKSNQQNYQLPKLSISPRHQVSLHKRVSLVPSRFFFERSVKDFSLVHRLKKKYTCAEFREIESLNEYLKGKPFSLRDYNGRSSTFFLIQEKGAALLPCPCSAGSVSCGYQILNLGFGCPLECTYCYLQGYSNVPGLLIPANIDEILSRIKIPQGAVRIGTGQFTDSLVFDHITEFSPRLIGHFKQYRNVTFEFKTKTDNIELLLTTKPSPNIIVAWSMNPSGLIKSNEFYAAPYRKRLAAALRCQQAGYRLAFHFDPVIMTDDWKEAYEKVFRDICSVVDQKRIAWISVGTLRMTSRLKQVIENRFPANTILDGELVLGFDNKLRYAREERVKVYKEFKSWRQRWASRVPLYLCMEDLDVYQDVGLKPLTLQ